MNMNMNKRIPMKMVEDDGFSDVLRTETQERENSQVGNGKETFEKTTYDNRSLPEGQTD